MSDSLKAVYDPVEGKIGCVLLQAAMSGDPAVAKMFPNEDWVLHPVPGLQRMEATRGQWKWLASLSREQRVERWRAHT